ncbi:hypothetical protein BKP37_16030 [Anaerobacillus alkalilacustris]|uniref:Uncharacterized protein n=1 Tax=Anaerobacillus alkalilacustris TaxID=393763 RepID=A0A1S2LHH7_9BACI|nr:hypothetical protein [Anaerobacillus alkalilacustris]OIJ11167.1 hypothetical protein BKP37_16030 [Anaerobacillus alkalilacustris]
MNCLSQQEEILFEAYIILSFARKVLQNDLLIVEKSFLKLKEPYIQLIHSSIGSISKELFEIKQQLHKRNIKIEFGNNDGTFTEFHCYFRGYVKTSRFLNLHLRNKVQDRLSVTAKLK